MYIYFYTFGCKVNQYETELLKQRLTKDGHTAVRDLRLADICVINSCTVTSQADLKLRQLIHKIRRENCRSAIALVGCYPQAFADTLGCEIVLGAENKQTLPEAVKKYIETHEKILDISDGKAVDTDCFSLESAGSKTRGIIKVQDGCDRFCSYCIIPYARGRSRSKPIEAIKKEAEALSIGGQKELVIVGINLSDYGKGTGHDLSDAVKAAAEASGVRIRLGSLEPEELTPEIIYKLSEIKNLCPHFHLAIQSGCDKTLREMRRKYDKEKYFTIVNELRRLFPGCALTTDIMVGFPGETDSDFEESLETVKAICFADAHIFTYSPRDGTPAAKRDDQVAEEVKNRRAKMMAEEVSKSAAAYKNAQEGRTLEVLFEREKVPGFHRGHSENYQVVKVKSFTDTMFRKIAKVKITGVWGDELLGEIVQR